MLTGALAGGVGNVAGNLASGLGTVGSGIVSGAAGAGTGAALTGGNVLNAIGTGALTGGVSAETGQLMNGQDPSLTAAAKSVTGALTNSAITGAPINASNLATGALTSAGLTAGANAATNPSTPSNNDINNALVTAMQNPDDTSGNTTYEPIASNDGTPLVPSGSVTMGSPNDNPTTSPISPDLTPKEQYDRLMQTPGMDSATASEISGYDPSTDSTDMGNIVVDANAPPTAPSDVVVTPTSNLPSMPNNTNATTGNLPVAPVAPPNNLPVEEPIGNLTPDFGTINVDAPKPTAPTDVGTIVVDANAPTSSSNTPVETPTTTTTKAPVITVNSNSSTTSSTAPSTSSNTSSGALSSASTQVPAVSAPTQIVGTELAGAPMYSQNSQILEKLQQLYPQLSQVNPKLLTQLGFPTAESQIAQVPQNQSLSQTSLDENYNIPSFKTGGLAHTPEFITGHTGHYASGKGDGQSDDIKALLNDGDYVMDADAVAQLGNGSSKGGKEVLEHFRKSILQTHHASGGKVPAMIADGEYVLPASFVAALGKGDSDAGAKMLDKMRLALREHKRSAPLNKIPPKSKSPLEYMREGLKMKAKG